MASKITPQNVKDMQFVAEQFNAVLSFDTFLQGVIDNQEAILSGRIGAAVFNSTTQAIIDQVKRASLCLCAAELLQLRMNRLSGNADADTALMIRTLQASQSNYLKEAEEKISRLISSGASADSGGYAGGVVITSGDDPTLTRLWP
jgi:hypothetical protein